jgi:PAS domain S-box-containing protein
MLKKDEKPVRKEGKSQSEEQFRQVIRVSGIGIFDHDHLTDTIYWSPEQRMIYGWGPDETVTLPRFLEQVYPEDRERIAAAVQIAHNPSGDGKFDVDHRIIRRDGTIRWLSTRSQTFFGEKNGKTLSVRTVGAVLDITERKKIEETLQQSEERLQLAIRSSRIGIYDHNHLTETLHWSAEMREILGVGPDEKVTLQTYLNLIPPEDLEKITEAVCMAHSPTSGGLYNIEHRIIRPDGELRWLYARSQTSFTGQGSDRRPVRTVGAIIDITERKESEIALRESEARLAEAQRISHLGYWKRDIGTNKIWWSEECYRIFGMDPESETSYQSFLERVHSEDRQFIQDTANTALNRGTPYSIDYRIVLPDQTEKVVHAQAKIIFDEKRAPVRLSGTIQDITGQKKMEEEVSKTQKLESLGLLAGGIAHDFNNILTAILGNISLAKVTADPQGPIFKILGQAETASFRAKELTNQLLTFAKGGVPIKKLNSISKLLKESAEFVLRGSNVRAELIIPNDLWPVEIDEGQMAQVIQNLVINAQQAMPEGGIVEIWAENIQITPEQGKELSLKEGAYIKISFKDTGVGIPAESLPKIFDPFFTTKKKGSGLGLSTSYSISKKHEGLISVSSEPGRGTIFFLFLPAILNRPFPLSEGVQKQLETGKGRILIMDDEESVREIGGMILNQLGYEVEYAKDGTEAVEFYRKGKEEGRPFDLVIFDLTISGGMSGLEALQKLIKIDPNINGVVSSGYADNPIMSDFQKHGFAGRIAKPYRIEEFSNTIATLIKKNRMPPLGS